MSRYAFAVSKSKPVPRTQTTKRLFSSAGARRTRSERFLDFNFPFSDAMSLEPMEFGPVDAATGKPDNTSSFHFTQTALSKCAIKSPPLPNRFPARQHFDLRNVAQK